jgi:hypothetical protein
VLSNPEQLKIDRQKQATLWQSQNEISVTLSNVEPTRTMVLQARCSLMAALDGLGGPSYGSSQVASALSTAPGEDFSPQASFAANCYFRLGLAS